ncbi:hypothetical protein N7448_009765 [Penicillium atrosanguineum]|uniref:uncharacterized protein n=1 Tax=Penicillium atrosanguineum TaxID=1132637 RepID=UPI002398C746|nr:uncharacterized protein N7443_007015 [Penicillium atrosanguineum]KAJ5123668.1 hypothetical protein N7448_009765 [Penicillium atrosanguineum]KAJ5142297.1 hypothetical protein N7526_003292 [Penicillium atrosanguineum]KAJ5298895.1 hypothetical protein N7443_007015 [Penicillium atrosanguineum]
MRLTLLPLLLFSSLALGNTLNVTVLGAQNNISTLECWALLSGFKHSSEAGTAGSESLNLGKLGGDSTYTILPAGFNGGRHNAPALQWVIFLSGLAHITLPNSTAEAWVAGGKNGAILALDTADVSAFGHYTTYPSKEQTITLEIPLGNEGIPAHTVLHGGPCKGEELSA